MNHFYTLKFAGKPQPREIYIFFHYEWSSAMDFYNCDSYQLYQRFLIIILTNGGKSTNSALK